VVAGEIRNALAIIARILDAGERTHPPGAENHWLKLSARDHIRRGLVHADRALVGALSGEDHLAYAATRFILALEQRERSLLAAESLQTMNQDRRVR
jgi:hypothetical protein